MGGETRLVELDEKVTKAAVAADHGRVALPVAGIARRVRIHQSDGARPLIPHEDVANQARSGTSIDAPAGYGTARPLRSRRIRNGSIVFACSMPATTTERATPFSTKPRRASRSSSSAAWRASTSKKRLPGPSRDSFRGLSAATAMGQVACALGDASLYERSVRIHSPRPNSLQAEDIAEQYLRFGPVERAVEWLTRSEDRAEGRGERLELLAQAYEQLGNRELLLDARRRIAEETLSLDTFARYEALLPEHERPAARQRAIERVSKGQEPVGAALFLFELSEPDRAAALALRERERLRSSFYGNLIALAERFEKSHTLAAIVCIERLWSRSSIRVAPRPIDTPGITSIAWSPCTLGSTATETSSRMWHISGSYARAMGESTASGACSGGHSGDRLAMA